MGEKYERIRKEKEEMNEVIKEKENEIKNMSKDSRYVRYVYKLMVFFYI
jgi:uncharacterized protein (UPF0335 family)